MKTILVSLGGSEYSIQPLPIKAARTWREGIKQPLNTLVDGISQAMAMEFSADNVPSFVAMGKTVVAQLVDAPDLILDLLCAYSPTIAGAKETIEETAYDEEVVDAFLKVLQLAYPLGRLMAGLGRTNPGT